MDPLDPTPNLTHPDMIDIILEPRDLPDGEPYRLLRAPAGWVLVDSHTGEIADEFGDDEQLARQTCQEQNEL